VANSADFSTISRITLVSEGAACLIMSIKVLEALFGLSHLSLSHEKIDPV
jgi:hypothetical protein